jgi:GDP-6-deoxy-D-talose 4-dehydrogenase
MVTGASGFTGQHLCALARKSGYEVVKVKSDLLDRSSLADELILAKPDLVAHLAAISYVGSPDKSSFYSVNVIGTTNLLDVISELPKTPGKVLLASSANVYGNCDISPISENTQPRPVNHYAASKFAMEQLSRTYSSKLSIVITRPFNYTGRGQHINFVIPKLVDHFSERKSSISLGNIDVEREFNDVHMVCDLYLKLLKFGVPGEIYNICSNNAYSLDTVIGLLVKLTGHSLTVNVDPEFVRPNEVQRLCGDPRKINELVEQHSEILPNISLEETLKSMLGK